MFKIFDCAVVFKSVCIFLTAVFVGTFGVAKSVVAQQASDALRIEIFAKPVIGQSLPLSAKLIKKTGEGALSFSWQIVSKPTGSTAQLVNNQAINAQFVPDAVGEYVVGLSVSDANGIVETKQLSFNTGNNQPIAKAGNNQFSAVGKMAVLSGENSYDVDGDKLNYAWTLLQSPEGSNAQLVNENLLRPTITLDTEGDYVAQLVVTDENGFSSQPSIVRISTLGGQPFANAGPDRAVMLGQTIGLNPFSSYHASGEQMSVNWSVVSKPVTSVAEITTNTNSRSQFIADVSGSYLLMLSVDDGGETSVDTVLVNVGTSVNTATNANAGVDQAVELGANIVLSGLKSSDLDGDELTYKWSLIARPNTSSASVLNTDSPVASFNVDVSGDYVAQLIVSDGKSSHVDTVLISTNNIPPQVQVSLASLLNTAFTSDVSAAGSNDPNGDTLTYQWSIAGLVGNLPLVGQFTQENQPQTAITFSQPPNAMSPENFLRDYSAVVFRKMVARGKVDGRVFVGGNLQSKRSKFGFGLLDASNKDVLTVKKNIRGRRIKIARGGNVRVGGSVTANIVLNGAGAITSDSTIDVDAKSTALITLSAQLKNLTANSAVEFTSMPNNWRGLNHPAWNTPRWRCDSFGHGRGHRHGSRGRHRHGHGHHYGLGASSW